MSEKGTMEQQELLQGLLIANAAQEEDSITVPTTEIFRQLKKYFLLWIIVAVVGAGLVFGGTMVLSPSRTMPLRAMVGFSFDGVEQGLDPDGNEFDANNIKVPTVIETTLMDLNMDASLVDSIRSNLTISGVVPDTAVDQLTAYQSIFESTNSIEAAKRIMETSYYPTNFKVEFSYANVGMTRADGAEFLNALLENYKTYFMQTYGYNEAFGDAMTSVDYTTYDYAQALDVYSSTLNSLQSYINRLSTEDATRFRSTETGYTFSDLTEKTNTLRNVDLASVSSYVFKKNVTKDREALQTYYEYRIDTLTRSMNSSQEQMATLTESIEKYQKDSVVIMAGENSSTPMLQSSEAYDSLVTQKTDAQKSVSSYQSQIKDYTDRLENLKKKSLGTNQDKEKVEADMDALSQKINDLVEDTQATAEEFFETASFENAYNILVPASGSASGVVSAVFQNMRRTVLIVEALLFVFYLGFAVVRAFIVSYRRNENMKKANTKKAADAE